MSGNPTRTKQGLQQPNFAAILERIDTIRAESKGEETLYRVLAATLFLAGIACIVTGLATGEHKLVWSSAVLSTLLVWPMRQLWKLHLVNVLLATLPSIVQLLSPHEASQQLKQFLKKLYEQIK